jgi:hypothetical protein
LLAVFNQHGSFTTYVCYSFDRFNGWGGGAFGSGKGHGKEGL